MKKIYTIGREENCDIVIPDNTDVISRLHATIRVEPNNKMFLIDQSRNGTYINGMKMTSNVEIPITRKDVVSFAHIHELDWSLIPKPEKNWTKLILIALACVVTIIGIALAAITLLDKPDNRNKSDGNAAVADTVDKDSTSTDEGIGLEAEDAITDAAQMQNDTTENKKDSVEKNEVKKKVVQSKKKEKEKEKAEDTNSTESEEIYNPIY